MKTSWPSSFALSAGLVAALVVTVAFSCHLSGTADAGAPCAAPTPGIDTCVLPAMARGVVAADVSWPALSAAVAKTCGTDQSTVTSIWGAHVQAEVIEGFVPKLIPAPVTSTVGADK